MLKKSHQWRYRQQQQQQQGYRQRVLDQDMQKQLRLSLHASDMLIQQQPQQQQQQQQSAWILQTTEDGSERYYYNIQTQEMRYSMPPDFYPEEQVLYSNPSNGSLSDTFQQQDERPPVRPVRAANRGITESFYGGDFRKTRNLTDFSYLPSRAASTVPTAQTTLIKTPVESEFEDDIKVKQVCVCVYTNPYLLSCLLIGFVK